VCGHYGIVRSKGNDLSFVQKKHATILEFHGWLLERGVVDVLMIRTTNYYYY
jgi:hypothetical protein